MKSYLGIDAAWSENQPSALAVIDENEHLQGLYRSYEEVVGSIKKEGVKPKGSYPDFDKIFSYFKNQKMDIENIAVDMPVHPTDTGRRRGCDNQIASVFGKYGAATHSPNGKYPGDLGVKIHDQWKDLGYVWETIRQPKRKRVFFETYPHAAIIRYLKLDYRLAYKVSKMHAYWKTEVKEERKKRLIRNLNKLYDYCAGRIKGVEDHMDRLDEQSSYYLWQLKTVEDRLDAMICALVSLDHAKGRTQGYGDQEGAVWVPESH